MLWGGYVTSGARSPEGGMSVVHPRCRSHGLTRRVLGYEAIDTLLHTWDLRARRGIAAIQAIWV